jgi:threonine dehydrogenase-like Zn-dependent dehydrogenase
MNYDNLSLRKENKIVKITNIPYPIFKKNHSIIKIKYMGICKTDIDVIHNNFTIDNLTVGHEVSGYIVESDMFEIDTYVGINPYNENGMNGLNNEGFFSQYIIVPNNRIHPVSNNLLATYIEPVAASLIDIEKYKGNIAVYGEGRIPNIIFNILKKGKKDLLMIKNKEDIDINIKYNVIIQAQANSLNDIIDIVSNNGTIVLRNRTFQNEQLNSLTFIKKGLSIDSFYYNDFRLAATYINNNEDFLLGYMGEIFNINNWQKAINKAMCSDKKIFLTWDNI